MNTDFLTSSPYTLPLLEACLYVVVFGGLSIMRREGLSVQFALESIVVTAIVVGGAWLIGSPTDPLILSVLLLALLFLVTMRSRWVVDLANRFAQRRNYGPAFRLYQLGLAWWPDVSARLIVLANRGAAELRSGEVDAAIKTLEGVLNPEHESRLGMTVEAQVHFNLGYAYELAGEDAKSTAQYNQAIDTMPGSLFAHAAESALKRRKERTQQDG